MRSLAQRPPCVESCGRPDIPANLPVSLTERMAPLASAGPVRRLGPAEDEMVGPQLPPSEGAWGQAVLMAETSNSRVTLSLTRTPPASSAAFQLTP